MTKPAIFTGAILGFLLLIGVWLSSNYNSLVLSKNNVEKSWGTVEVQYQRRLDLIDNIVESAKGSQKQEIAVFGLIADARKNYNSATSSAQKAEAASVIETNVAMIPRLQEAYPELKSNDNIKSLITELQTTEGTIATARTNYNEVVAGYNLNVMRFPSSIFADLFGFEKQPLFKSESGAEKGSKVSF